MRTAKTDDARKMPPTFTVYALSLSENLDTETECATLDEALTHLRELITSEMEAPHEDGPMGGFDRFGIAVDRT